MGGCQSMTSAKVYMYTLEIWPLIIMVKFCSIQGFHLISREIKIHIQGSCPWGLVSIILA